ncbi:MAG: hypothetical protein NXI24_16130 [bacterium]|nr:hypothetical protein [bacterium]
MSGPSKNDSPSALRPRSGIDARSRAPELTRGPGDLFADPDYRINLWIFFIPLLFLLLEIPVSGDKPFFAAGVFLIGSLLELAIDGLLRLRAMRGSIGASRLARLQYLNHTILGLPITIYLASSAASPAAALLRLLPVLYLLSRARVRSQALIHLGLFAVGYLTYAAGLRYAWPGEREILQTVVGLALGGMLIWREGLVARSALRSARSRRDFARSQRRLSQIRTRETALLESILLTPDRVRRYQSDRAIAPLAGEMLCVAVGFPDLNRTVDDFARRARENRVHASVAFAEFEHEWDLCVDHYRRGLEEQGCLVIVGDAVIYGVELLKAPQSAKEDAAGDQAQGADFEALVERRTIELSLAMQSLLDFSTRSRRALEARGRAGWSARSAIARGAGAFVRRGPANPAIVGRGEVFLTLAAGLKLTGDSPGVGPAPPAAERLWIQGALAASVRRIFEGADDGSGDSGPDGGENWFSPGRLRAEYSLKGQGVEPAPDLFERLRYGGAMKNDDRKDG